MSALAGIFKYDPRNHVTGPELANLARGIDRIGPDGGGEYLQSNVGMVYRAFHTTAESHFECQPLVREGFVLAWDGRLDNRDEIRARAAANHEESPADVDLVFAAYREWGESCFAELMGDWALALWDPTRMRLILARDYIGVRRLFYRLDQEGVAWCSILEPLVLQSPCKLELDVTTQPRILLF
jgi:asparagine synthase (glutamine-hydrolysing)